MRYLRCRCGKREAWSSMGVPDCTGCPDCNTTLEEAASQHREPSPHDWQDEWRIVNPRTGESQLFQRCLRCNRSEPKPRQLDGVDLTTDALTIMAEAQKNDWGELDYAREIARLRAASHQEAEAE